MAPWDISTASFSQFFQLPSGGATAWQDLFIRNDGLKMYTLQDGIPGVIREYDLSTPWNITTASFVRSIFIADESGGLFFKPDGTKMYTVNLTQSRIFQYTLSTPWNISTATVDIGNRNVAPQDDSPSDIFFREDGVKMYVQGWENGRVYEYTLSMPWIVTSAIFTGFKDVSAQDPTPVGLWFGSGTNGRKMYVSGSVTSNSIHEYILSTGWSVSTAVFNQTLSVNSQDAEPGGVVFRPNGLQMFHIGDANERVYSYTLPPTPPKTFSIDGTLRSPKRFRVDARLARRKQIIIDAKLIRRKPFSVRAFIVPEPTDTWSFREHKTSSGVFNPSYTFQQEVAVPKRFQMISGSGFNLIGHGYLFKTFPISQITGSDIVLKWSEISGHIPSIGLAVYDGVYDPNSQVDFPDAVSGGTTITLKGGGVLGSTNASLSFGPHFNQTLTLSSSNINYAGSTTGSVTVFFVNFDSNQIPFNNILFDSIDVTKIAKFNFQNAVVTNVLTGTVRDWGYVGAGSVQSNVFKICDFIDTNTGWVKVNTSAPAPGEMVFIDESPFNDLIKLNGLLPGGGSISRYAYKDMGVDISGNDVKLEFKVDYESRAIGGFAPSFSVGLSQTTNHPQLQGSNSSIRVDFGPSIDPFCIMNGIVSNGVITKTTTSGAKGQHSLWVYPNNNNPVSDSSLKGPYYVSVELKNNKLRLSAYKDISKTQHIRGSPITVDATGINVTNLRYISVGNDFTGGSGRAITCTIDDICISTNVDPLETIPQKPIPATGSFIETWEGFATGDQNPPPWISNTEIVSNGGIFTPLIDIHEVTDINPVEGTKSFKLHQKFDRISGPPFGRVSVARFVPAVVRTDGSGLDIPLSLSAKMRTDIISSQSDPTGVMVGYDFIIGSPVTSSQRCILLKLYGSGAKTLYLWNGIEWITNSTLDIPISQSNPVTSVAEVINIDLKNILNTSATLSEINAIDFETHVTGIWVGYVGLNNSQSITEVLINGDTISMLNAGISIKTFTIDAIKKSQPINTFTIDARLRKLKGFTIDAHLPPIPKTPKVDARLVLRHAVNSAIADAILAGSVTITTQIETFFIDGQIQQPLYQSFTINAILINKRQKSFSIDMIITPLQEKTIKIDALVGLFEPQSILDVESVIGHDV